MIWYQEDYRDDVVLILRAQHYLAPATDQDGEEQQGAPRTSVSAPMAAARALVRGYTLKGEGTPAEGPAPARTLTH